MVAEQDSTIADLRSLLDRHNQELDSLEQSVTTTQEERTRLQFHSNEMTMSIVSLRQELEEVRAITTAARASEEAGRLQLTGMIDEQLAQNQTIEAVAALQNATPYHLSKWGR
jgi:septal ring factor EnvC (AmiA/AmiB activator)